MIDDPKQCRGTTRKGERCRDDALPTLGVCFRHVDQLDGDRDQDTAERPVWERARAEKLREVNV